MTRQNFNATSFFEEGKACPNCGGSKWVEDGKICYICQGTGAQKVPMPNIHDSSLQGPHPPMTTSLLNIHRDRPLEADEVYDTPWNSSTYVTP